MRTGLLTEATIQKMHDYEASDLSERDKAALALADRLAFDHRNVDAALLARLRASFSEEELLDLGMSIGFLLGWGRFIEAFGIVPEAWVEGTEPWAPLSGDSPSAQARS
jgi:alkylhydroperoxidase family enzyme